MGNKPCTIGIHTDQERYVAGSTIRGIIYLSVTGEALKASSLNICLIGEEKSVIHYTMEVIHYDTEENQHHGGDRRDNHRENSHTTTEDHYDRAKHTFFHLDYPIFKANNNNDRIPVGQYEYPFEVTIPSNLPGSMNYTSGESRCQIFYRMIATIHKDNDVQNNNFLGNVFSSGSYQHTKLIAITSVSVVPERQQLMMEGGEEDKFCMPSDIVPIRTCCCWRGNNGTIMIEPEILKINGNDITNNTTFCPSDKVTIGLGSKNNSIIAVKDVHIQLKEIIEWTNDKTHRRERSDHCSAATNLSLGEQYILQHMPELEKLTKQQQNQQIRQRSAEEESEQPMMLVLPKRQFSFVISPNINDTFEGRLISVRHILSVTLETEGCCIENPESCTDVAIRGKRKQQRQSISNNNAAAAESSNYSSWKEPQRNSKQFTNPNPSNPAFEYDEGPQATNTVASQPSAPSEIYDIMGDSNDFPEATGVIELPPVWSAQTADVVTIPMAHATLL